MRVRLPLRIPCSISSIGQSNELLIRGVQVRVLYAAPNKRVVMERKEFTPEEIKQIKESAMENARVSLLLEGIIISDADFEKIKAIADDLEKVI